MELMFCIVFIGGWNLFFIFDIIIVVILFLIKFVMVWVFDIKWFILINSVIFLIGIIGNVVSVVVSVINSELVILVVFLDVNIKILSSVIFCINDRLILYVWVIKIVVIDK